MVNFHSTETGVPTLSSLIVALRIIVANGEAGRHNVIGWSLSRTAKLTSHILPIGNAQFILVLLVSQKACTVSFLT